MKKATILIALVGIFGGFSYARAQSALVPLSQGQADEATSTCAFSGDCYFIYLGSGVAGTITTAFTTMTYTALNQIPTRFDIFESSSTPHSPTDILNDCQFTLTVPQAASSSQARLQYTGVCNLNSSLYYTINMQGSAGFSPAAFYWGHSFASFQYPQSYLSYGVSNFMYSGWQPQWALAVNGFQITPTTTDSGIFFSGAQSFCNNAFASTSGIGATIGNGFCVALGFLFVPTQTSLAQFADLEPLLSQKLPFSYIFQVSNTWNSLQASSTDNLPTYSIDMHSLGIGSTTALGNILPSGMDLLSTTTVNKYLPQGVHDGLFALAEFAIALTALASMYYEGRRVLHV